MTGVEIDFKSLYTDVVQLERKFVFDTANESLR
jgi:hypothetical protein